MKFINRDKKPVDLLTYACVLARCYGLDLTGPAKMFDGKPNPFYESLKEEQKLINEYLPYGENMKDGEVIPLDKYCLNLIDNEPDDMALIALEMICEKHNENAWDWIDKAIKTLEKNK